MTPQICHVTEGERNHSVTPKHHTASSVRDRRPSSYILSQVIVRIVRLVSFCPPGAELCSCDPQVHLFNVLTLSLKVVCGVVRAGHKYLQDTERGWRLHNQADVLIFSFRNLPDSSFHRHWVLTGAGWKQIYVGDETKSVKYYLKYENILLIWNATNFCMMGSRSSSAGWTSLSGLLVSIVVLTVAM